jgi:hypothetical protein
MRAVVAAGALAAMSAAGCHRGTGTRAPNEAGGSGGAPHRAANAGALPPDTAEGCRACNGDFGVHGLAPTPFCNCRTHDAGKRCRGKDDCESECVGDDGEREVVDPGPPPRGHRLGRCAEFRTMFGCHAFLPPHGAAPALVRLDQEPEEICVD